jgi:hypothetical protein
MVDARPTWRGAVSLTLVWMIGTYALITGALLLAVASAHATGCATASVISQRRRCVCKRDCFRNLDDVSHPDIEGQIRGLASHRQSGADDKPMFGFWQPDEILRLGDGLDGPVTPASER